MSAAPPPLPGARTPPELPPQFGRYQILKRLGRGGMGSVYLAHDTQLDRRVALKVPHFDAERGPRILERFYREARAAATLSHPNLCAVYDVGQVEGIPYLTMAYVEGRPLSDFIDPKKPIAPRQAAAVVRKLALAMQEAHAKGVIHRDLKPANVMITAAREPVVLDFGLSRLLGKDQARLTREGRVVGTPTYMAPEQILGDESAAGPACDVYALGVILYELLTGRAPFEGTTLAVLSQIPTVEPPPASALRPDLDARLEAICHKAMAKKVTDRYASMAELAAALQDYLRGGQAAGPGASSAERVRPPDEEDLAQSVFADLPTSSPTLVELSAARAGRRGRRPRWPWLAAGGAAVTAVLVGVVLLASRGEGTARAVARHDVPSRTREPAVATTPATQATPSPPPQPRPPATTSPGAKPDPVKPPAPQPPSPTPPPQAPRPALAPDAPLAVLRQALKDKDPAVQALAAGLLANRGPAAVVAVEDLAQVLKGSENLEVRRNAAIALGRIGEDAWAATPVLAETLAPGVPVLVRRHAAEALAKIGYPSNEKALPSLVNAVEKDRDPLVRQYAVWALEKFPNLLQWHGARDVLTAVLEETNSDGIMLRYTTARLLAVRLGEKAPERTGDILLEMLQNKTLREYSGSGVQVKNGGGAATAVERNVGGDARFMAAEALSLLGEKASGRKDIVTALRAATADPDPRLQKAARTALKTLKVN
jgi:serine/threonine protein kinase